MKRIGQTDRRDRHNSPVSSTYRGVATPRDTCRFPPGNIAEPHELSSRVSTDTVAALECIIRLPIPTSSGPSYLSVISFSIDIIQSLSTQRLSFSQRRVEARIDLPRKNRRSFDRNRQSIDVVFFFFFCFN